MVVNFFVETFSLGVKNIHRHKLRSLLTTLGIIIGVAAVIIMVAIGEGAKQAAIEQLRRLGARNIVIRSVAPPESNDASSRAQAILDYGIRRLDLQRLRELPDLENIVPLRDTLQQRITVGDKRVPANAIGTVPDIFPVLNLRADRGRVLTQVDLDQQSHVCVLAASAAEALFPFQDPIGQHITIGGQDQGSLLLEVVGILGRTGLRPTGGIMARDLDWDIYIPLTLTQSAYGDTVLRRNGASRERRIIELTEIWMQVKEGADVEQIASMALNILQMNHTARDYEVKVPIEILRAAEQQSRLFNAILGGIASLSLVVGGIGIMNIMLASVTERTKEIGIRRALGAKQKHITLQFLVETTVVSLTGGIIGIASGCIVAILIPIVVRRFSDQPYPTSIATWSVLGSFIISGLIGVGFGLYPAMTAAKMNPIEALRHE